METTVSPQQADLRADESAIPLVPQDEKGPQEALAKLAEEAARATAHLRPAVAVNFAAGPRVAAPSIDPIQALRAGDKLVAEPAASPRRAGRSLLRFVLAVTVGVAATLTWQSYGEAARQAIAAYVPTFVASPAPLAMPASTGAGHESDRTAVATVDAALAQVPALEPPAPLPSTTLSLPAVSAPMAADMAQQIESLAHELATLRETVSKVSATQDQMARSVAKLQDADEEASRTPPPPPRPAARARKPAAAAPRQAPLPPVAQAVAPPATQAVNSAPLPPLAAPPPSPVPELNRRPPASMP